MNLKDTIKIAQKERKERRELAATDKWTPSKIRKLILKNDVFVERSLCVLFARQTSTEQETECTNINNNMGFTGADAKFLSSLAKQIKENKYSNQPGKRLSTKQRYWARKRLDKYAKQLAVYANTKDVVRAHQALGVTVNPTDFQKGGIYGKV